MILYLKQTAITTVAYTPSGYIGKYMYTLPKSS